MEELEELRDCITANKVLRKRVDELEDFLSHYAYRRLEYILEYESLTRTITKNEKRIKDNAYAVQEVVVNGRPE